MHHSLQSDVLIIPNIGAGYVIWSAVIEQGEPPVKAECTVCYPPTPTPPPPPPKKNVYINQLSKSIDPKLNKDIAAFSAHSKVKMINQISN